MTIGQRVIQLRKEKGMTRQELADKANISVSPINLLETDLKEPSVNTLRKIAKALGKELVIESV